MNFITVKIGEKYTATYVNRVFEMCQKFVSFPFTFFCYTDDPTGIHPEIEIIDFVDHGLKPIVHNKLFLFSDQFEKKLCSSGPRVFFDLDIVIRGNIDQLVFYAYQQQDKLAVINASWKQYTRDELNTNVNIHTINSSCMVWEPYKNKHIWENYIANRDSFEKKYNQGMDALLTHEHNLFGRLPEQLFCSYLHGVPKKYFRVVTTYEQYKKIEQSFPIVLFNGPTTDKDVTTFIESGYTSSFFDLEPMFSTDKEEKNLAFRQAEQMLYERTISQM